MSEQQPQSPALPEAPAAQPAATLAEQLRALPPLPAPAGIWQRVQQRSAAKAAARRAGQRRQRVALALAASLLAAVATVLLVGQRDAPPVPARAFPNMAAATHTLKLPAVWPPVPAAVGAEQLMRARIASIDATLNGQLLQGNGARPALLRERETLAASLRHVQQHRQQVLVRHAVY